jgi:hypothetical protein
MALIAQCIVPHVFCSCMTTPTPFACRAPFVSGVTFAKQSRRMLILAGIKRVPVSVEKAPRMEVKGNLSYRKRPQLPFTMNDNAASSWPGTIPLKRTVYKALQLLASSLFTLLPLSPNTSRAVEPQVDTPIRYAEQAHDLPTSSDRRSSSQWASAKHKMFTRWLAQRSRSSRIRDTAQTISSLRLPNVSPLLPPSRRNSRGMSSHQLLPSSQSRSHQTRIS